MESNKTIWIFNHYATNMFYYRIGRHHSYARYLHQNGYHVRIFCASAWHKGMGENVINDNKLYHCDSVDDIDYVFVQTRDYVGNGKQRVLNIIDYYRNIYKVYKNFECPDLIIGSSVHPLACVAAIKIGKRFGCKTIAEIRDLWPASLIEYGVIKANGIPATLMTWLEKWIYRKADSIIMTWPGGVQYIHDRGWSNGIPDSKVYHLSNGVELSEYRLNALRSDFHDDDLIAKETFKVVYTGSVSTVNNIGVLVEAARILKERNNSTVKIFIYGKGNELEKLKEKVASEGLDNIVFKGFVARDIVPAVLSHADITILHNSSTGLNKYGQSQNKFFEYLAAGKPILMTYSVGYSVCKENNCGVELDEQTPEAIADAIEYFSNLSPEQYKQYSQNAERTAEEYDYKTLSKKLMRIIDETLSK